MDKDINNLEEIINLCKEEINNNDKNITATLDLEDLKSLKNFLDRYKQLEEENSKKSIQIRQLKSDIQDLENECIALHNLIDEEM